MRVLLAVLLVTAALAGCTDPQSTDLESQDAEPTPQPGPEPEPEPESESEPNTAPAASLTADAATGEAPLNVTFTLDGFDADGDNLTWTFDADGDGVLEDQGDALPATVLHAYAAGNFTARLVVYDGEAEANATVRVESFEPAGPSAPTGPVQELTVSWAVGGDGVGAEAEAPTSACGGGPADGVTYATFAVDTASHGRPFTATVSMEEGADAFLGWYVQFLDDACEELLLVIVLDASDLAETVPAGAATAFVSSLGGVSLTASYSAG